MRAAGLWGARRRGSFRHATEALSSDTLIDEHVKQPQGARAILI